MRIVVFVLSAPLKMQGRSTTTTATSCIVGGLAAWSSPMDDTWASSGPSDVVIKDRQHKGRKRPHEGIILRITALAAAAATVFFCSPSVRKYKMF
jgi:hypothetical protein